MQVSKGYQIFVECVYHSPRHVLTLCCYLRRRKIRCDKNLPCSYCVKIGGRCEYPFVESTNTHTASSVVNTTSRIQALEEQVQRLTSVLPSVGVWKNATSVLSASPTSSASPERSLVQTKVASSGNTPTSAGFALRLSPECEVSAPLLSLDHVRDLWRIYLSDIDRK